ncbi:MAG: hypothetical protein B6I17_01905 [Tenericutes bacterium 4572_104]|nr:MAG: hypothetical protein B6I17_01905 [Tenericutes bacterium 4572_104]
MRVFGRFLYALIAVGFFLLSFTYSRDLMLTKYLNDVFGTSLVDENSDLPKFYYFYSSIPDYYKSDPIIAIENNGYDIYGYEVARANIDANNNLVITESVYLIVYSSTEDLSQVDYLYLENQTNNATQEISLQRFKTLNLINGINDEGRVYLAKDLFLDDNYNTINLVNKDGELLVSTNFGISDSDFTIKTFIETFYTQNNRLPEVSDFESLTNNNIFPNKPHIADDYAYIFYIAMGIYFTLLILSTYLIFFKKRRKDIY